MTLPDSPGSPFRRERSEPFLTLPPLDPTRSLGAVPSRVDRSKDDKTIGGDKSELMAIGPGLFPDTRGAADPAGTLELEEVLQGLERTYPPLLSVFLERANADAENLSARGAFDLNVNADTRNYPLGYYRRAVHDVFLEQPTPYWGAKFFGGYRLGYGRYPSYYQYLQTRGGGAFVSGMELPLLKNRSIDAKRAKIVQTQIERLKVEPTIMKRRIEAIKNASKAYWAWVASGQRYAIYEDYLAVAEERNRGLTRQAEIGAIPELELVDNRRVILQRQIFVVAARRKLEQAAIDLSLYLRDERLLPVIPSASRLPSDFPAATEPDLARLDEDLDVALRLRPELASLRFEARKAEVELTFARNQMLPSLNLYIYGEQNFGDQPKALLPDNRPYVMETSLLMDVPLQRRYARGRVFGTETQLRQIAIEQRYAGDRIAADVRDTMSALITAYDIVQRNRENVRLNIRLQESERRRLELGNSTVLLVNLREQAAADAEGLEVDALYEYHRALAEYRAATAVDVQAFATP